MAGHDLPGAMGYGGVAAVARATQLAISTVREGRDEGREGAKASDIVKVRRSSGKRPFEAAHPEAWPALEALVDPATRGGPESPLRWTCRSTPALAAELLARHGIRISDRTAAKLLSDRPSRASAGFQPSSSVVFAIDKLPRSCLLAVITRMERLILEDYVVLRSGFDGVVFRPSSMRLFQLQLPHGAPLSDAAPASSDAPAPVAPAPADPRMLGRRRALLPLFLERDELASRKLRPAINRFTLNISNACNLWCSYCYADHGTYHSPKSLMEPATAEAIVAKVADCYSQVGRVQFFGGEPLMNLPAIHAVGECFERLAQSGYPRPRYTATTNGTYSSPDVMAALARWDMALTVSWDGPKEVHDPARPMNDRKASSFDLIQDSLARFADAGVPVQIECTYGYQHLAAGLSVVDLLEFFYERTGRRTAHVAPLISPDPAARAGRHGPQRVFRDSALRLLHDSHVSVEQLVPAYRDAARLTVDNMFRGDGPLLSFAQDITKQILQRRRSEIYCPAFFDQLSVAIDGTVYPCFMFIGDPRFCMGNILGDALPNPAARRVMKEYFEEFGTSRVGSTAWYAPLLGGCIAGDYIATHDMGTRALAPIFEAIIEECLLGVSRNSARVMSDIADEEPRRS